VAEPAQAGDTTGSPIDIFPPTLKEGVSKFGGSDLGGLISA
jgi:hypothetical protein